MIKGFIDRFSEVARDTFKDMREIMHDNADIFTNRKKIVRDFIWDIQESDGIQYSYVSGMGRRNNNVVFYSMNSYSIINDCTSIFRFTQKLGISLFVYKKNVIESEQTNETKDNQVATVITGLRNSGLSDLIYDCTMKAFEIFYNKYYSFDQNIILMGDRGGCGETMALLASLIMQENSIVSQIKSIHLLSPRKICFDDNNGYIRICSVADKVKTQINIWDMVYIDNLGDNKSYGLRFYEAYRKHNQNIRYMSKEVKGKIERYTDIEANLLSFNFKVSVETEKSADKFKTIIDLFIDEVHHGNSEIMMRFIKSIFAEDNVIEDTIDEEDDRKKRRLLMPPSLLAKSGELSIISD